VSGSQGLVLRYDGTIWTETTIPTPSTSREVWGATPEQVWVLTDGDDPARWNGTQWELVTTGEQIQFRGMWGSSPESAFASGWNAVTGDFRMLAWDGASWTSVNVTGQRVIYKMWGASDSRIFAGSDDGVLVYNGSTWALDATAGTPSLARSVWGNAPTEVYAGAGRNIYLFDGTSWTDVGRLGTDNISDIWTTTDADVFATEQSGAIIRGHRNASLTVADLTLNGIGVTATTSVSVTDGDGIPITASVALRFTSLDPGVATVDSITGLVTTVSAGVASIVATAPGGVADTGVVTVTDLNARGPLRRLHGPPPLLINRPGT